MKTLSNFEQIAKKNKHKSWLKIVSLSTVATLAVAGGLFFTLEKMASSNGEKVKDHYLLLSEIAYPNIDYISWGFQPSSYFSGNFYSNRIKDIDGIMVPFEQYTGSYSIQLRNQFNQDESLKKGDDGKSSYTYGQQYKVPVFYGRDFEDTEYKKVTHDLNIISQMEGQAVEVAITFDKAYSLAEIEQKVPENLKLNWVWIGQEVGFDFRDDLSEQYGFTIYPDVSLNAEEQAALEEEVDKALKKDAEADLSPIYDKYNTDETVTPLQSMQNSYTIFQANAQKYIDANYGSSTTTGPDGKTYSADQHLKDFLEANQDPETAAFAGVILTGRAENFAQLQNADWIYASNIGQSVQIQPYHQLEK